MKLETIIKKALNAQHQFNFAEENYQKAKYTYEEKEKHDRVKYWYKKISNYREKISFNATTEEYLNYLKECEKIEEIFNSRKSATIK